MPTTDYQQIAQDFINQVQIPASVTFEETPEFLKFELETDQPGLVIGFHGEMLQSLEKILGLVLEKQTGVWKKVVLNVGDYRERREETLKNLAMSAAQRVKFSGQEWPLPNLSASERRIVHTILTDHPDVVTESVGDGDDRRLVVKPRVQK